MQRTVLETDGYKFSMAEAGWPLRTETFSYTHRKGGLQFLPVDVEAFVQEHLPRPTPEDYLYLERIGYEMGAGFRTAILKVDRLQVRALPRGSWFTEREPVFSVTGPSALVSWLEPLMLQLHYRIQLATAALLRPDSLRDALQTVTCDAVRRIARETLSAVGVDGIEIEACPDRYQDRVLRTARDLVDRVGSPDRLFEVGLRAAVSTEEHALALEALEESGIRRTSHVELARRLDMIPVGTMGHEHVQRFGSDDAAFRAMVERRPQRSSFLLDTYDTCRSGIPTAFRLMQERPGQRDSIRYDSGDKESQYRFACRLAREMGIDPVHVLEDGFDQELTSRFEELREEEGVSPERQFYGYGGYLIARPSGSPFTRDRVAAVWKLTRTGTRPCMKFGNEPGGGKESIPGLPVVFRREGPGPGPFGIIGQEGETPPPGYRLLTGSESRDRPEPPPPTDDLSAIPGSRTRELMSALRRESTVLAQDLDEEESEGARA